MSYTISAADFNFRSIRMNESDPLQSALQHIALILFTPKGSVPLYRDFGLSRQYLDKPAAAVRTRMVSEVREAIERWEPRAAVLDVSFSADPDRPDVLYPTVEVEISLE